MVLTLSGAMTIAKMGKVIAKMIDAGMVQAVVSTGALMAHGLSEAVGMVHYRHDPRMSDEELFDKGYNRVYDTLEMEANLNYVEEFAAKALDELAGRARALERDHLPQAGRGPGPRTRTAPACCGAPTSRRCRSTCPPSPTPSWASTSPPGP